MIYAQISSGLKMHMVYEPGEGPADAIVRAGHLSAPLCGTRAFSGHFRMTCNLPLAHACKNCVRVWRARR